MSDELIAEETHEINHLADSEENLDKLEIYGIDRDSRWYSHGTTIESGESYSTTAVFVIESDIDPSAVSIRFQPYSGLEEHFVDDVFQWA